MPRDASEERHLQSIGEGMKKEEDATSSKSIAPPLPLTTYPPHYPPFPEPGSILGGRYFVLQRLGQGTFCSIHKCVDLSYVTSSAIDITGNEGPCMVAAKVELSNFVNSGVLEGEAMVLRHLHQNMAPLSVPHYGDFLRSVPTQISKEALGGSEHEAAGQQPQQQPQDALVGENGGGNTTAGECGITVTNISAIMMEYLPGEDMARLRDRCCLVQKHNVAAALHTRQSSGAPSMGFDSSVRNYSNAAGKFSKEAEAQNGGGGPPLARNGRKNHFNGHGLGGEARQEGDGMKYPQPSLALTHPTTPQQPPNEISLRENNTTVAPSIHFAPTSQSQQGAAQNSPLSQQSQHPTRRVNLQDSVYTCADILLPLLKNMHDTGVIHRDVKPSNVVRTGTTSADKGFKLVDFGLSKSFIVPGDSVFADRSHPWGGSPFVMMDIGTTTEKSAISLNVKANHNLGNRADTKPVVSLCQRKERLQAEFRGTSMYASLRVHELHDYCRRDDVWSLLYVFCDFCAGGLPWMYAASERDKNLVVALKDACHRDSNKHVEALLYGPSYHAKVTAVTRRLTPDPDKQFNLTQEERDALKVRLPNMATKIELLKRAFNHLAELKFADRPDYDLIESCLRGFVGDETSAAGMAFEDVPGLDWNMPDQHIDEGNTIQHQDGMVQSLGDYAYSISGGLLDNLDLLLNLKIAKADYNARNTSYFASLAASPRAVVPGVGNVVKRQMLLDWLSSTELASHFWNVTSREKWGEQRSNTDGYRREEFVRWLERCCYEFFQPFQNFADHSFFDSGEFLLSEGKGMDTAGKSKSDSGESTNANTTAEMSVKKRRKIIMGEGGRARFQVSRAILALTSLRDSELMKKLAPPPKISFSA
jgi:serine/threonine protein kinase